MCQLRPQQLRAVLVADCYQISAVGEVREAYASSERFPSQQSPVQFQWTSVVRTAASGASPVGHKAWTAQAKVRFAEDEEPPRMEMTMALGRSLFTQTNLSYAFVPDAN